MENLVSPCGLYCGECKDLGDICKGCSQCKGKPYWTAKANTAICPLYDCCVHKKRIEHCGLCGEFPCQLFQNLHDPSLSLEEAEKEVRIRRNDLLRRKTVGTTKWLMEKLAGNKK